MVGKGEALDKTYPRRCVFLTARRQKLQSCTKTDYQNQYLRPSMDSYNKRGSRFNKQETDSSDKESHSSGASYIHPQNYKV